MDEISKALNRGETLEAAAHLAGLCDADVRALAEALVKETADRADLLDVISDLLAPPAFRAGTGERERLLRREGMCVLAGEVAVSMADENWRDLIPAIRVLGSPAASYRMHAAAARLISAVSSIAFDESRELWLECLLDGADSLAVCALRGLASSEAPALKLMELFSTVRSDLRKDIRHNLASHAVPEVGKREPKIVFQKLREWAAEDGEVVRWNVAKALAEPLGGVYVETAIEILGIFAVDERPSVWQAAARALVHLAERRPSFVLPILARWREDEERKPCALMALEALTRSRERG